MKYAIILFFACTVWAAPKEETPLKQLAVGNRKFAADVYREILKTKPRNLIFSPFSAEAVLALLSDGANGATFDELVTGISLPSSKASIQQAFKEFVPKVKSNTRNLKLASANRIYAGKDVKLEPAFQKTAVDVYESAVKNIDFSKNVEAAATINQWVEEQTNNKIKDLINKDDLNGDTALVLVNALYLQAKWLIAFTDRNTRPNKFWKTATESVDVPTMSETGYFNYYDNSQLGAQFLELPYQGEGLNMVIVLPHEKEGLTALEKDVGKLLEPQPMTRKRVDVKLPRFTTDSEIQFNDILKNLGVKKIFNTKADLTGLSSTHKDLYVSKVVQKAFINVTETGTEAAAATAGIVQTRAGKAHLEAEYIFKVDHPFLYFIRLNDILLFMGKYML